MFPRIFTVKIINLRNASISKGSIRIFRPLKRISAPIMAKTDDVTDIPLYGYGWVSLFEIHVHGPDEINGFHHSQFLIKVEYARHGNYHSDLNYIWYHDREQYDKGENLSIMEVSVEGLYLAMPVDVARKIWVIP